MSFYEYILSFDKIRRDINYRFIISEDSYNCFDVGSVILVQDLTFKDINSHVFVVIEENNISVPIEYLYYINSKVKNVDFVYQINNDKIIKKIGDVDKNVINEYKRNYILLNRGINSK